MDLSTPLSTASSESSSNSEAKDEISMVVPVASKRAKFFATYRPQNFSLPSDSVMYYIAQTPLSLKMYQKMIQTCKYFFLKNPIIVISGLRNYNNEWREGGNGVSNSKKYDLTKYLCKFWIIKSFYVGRKNVFYKKINPNLLSSITPKLYRCDVKELNFVDQILSYSELSLLISSAENITLNCVTIKYKNDSNVPFEKIVEIAVNTKEIHLYESPIISETMKELLKIPHFAKLEFFSVSHTSEVFEIETFYNYIITNYQKVWLQFVNPISDTYKFRLNKVIDKILATEVFTYKPPYHKFVGIDPEKFKMLVHYWRAF